MPDRYRFIAFSTITGQSQAHAPTAHEALTLATEHLPDSAFIEVVDCGDNGEKVWSGGTAPANPVPLWQARRWHRTVFRGDGHQA